MTHRWMGFLLFNRTKVKKIWFSDTVLVMKRTMRVNGFDVNMSSSLIAKLLIWVFEALNIACAVQQVVGICMLSR